ncbi:MAG: hypothetical protein HY784_03150 [Chloroflexi bacterium]|nr:hypothetical protein [Chloroflexota bacterium]
MVKTNLLVLLLARREDLGPRAVARGGYTRMFSAQTLIVCGPYELRGTVETPGNVDLSVLTVEGAGDFIAVYDVALNAVMFPDVHFRGAACLLNRRHIDFLTIVGNSSA